MVYNGIVEGNRIELDEPLPFADGTHVRVEVAPREEPRRGSPAALLRPAGTLTTQEADAILEGARECQPIDASLW